MNAKAREVNVKRGMKLQKHFFGNQKQEND
jgi:hypothetical protein